MISKTRLTELVKVWDWQAVARGLDENPKLLGHRDERGRNWLHLCSSIDLTAHPRLDAAASIKLAELLLARGLDLNAPAFTEGTWHATPLWYAIGRGHNLKLAAFLLKRGCNPNHALWAAGFNRDLDAIRVLVKHGADLDPVTEGDTPFLFAVKWSHFDAAELLLDLGANVDFRDRKGMTALHYMLRKGSAIEHLEMIVRHGARGDIADAKGQTAAAIMSRKREPRFKKLAERLKRGQRGP